MTLIISYTIALEAVSKPTWLGAGGSGLGATATRDPEPLTLSPERPEVLKRLLDKKEGAMKEIRIDLPVWKKIVGEWRDSDRSENDVLHRLLNVSSPSSVNGASEVASRQAMWCRGGTIPGGTRLQLPYKGREHKMEVREGKIWVEGDMQPYNSPSAAARSITKNSVDGWKVLEYEAAPGRWKSLDELRRQR